MQPHRKAFSSSLDTRNAARSLLPARSKPVRSARSSAKAGVSTDRQPRSENVGLDSESAIFVDHTCIGELHCIGSHLLAALCGYAWPGFRIHLQQKPWQGTAT